MKYFLFYTDCYDDLHEEFETEEQLVEFLEKKNWNHKGNSVIKIVHGAEIEVEPVEKITSWRVKKP